MSREENIPRVSASLLPPPGMNKRLFMPNDSSKFSDIKRRRLNIGIERIKPAKIPKLSTEERKWLQIEAEKEDIRRMRILNMLFYEKTKLSLNNSDDSKSEANYINDLCQIFNDTMEIEEIKKRPKFKPKTLPQNLKSSNIKLKVNPSAFDTFGTRNVLGDFNTPKNNPFNTPKNNSHKKFTFEKPDSTPQENRFNSPSCVTGRRNYESADTPKACPSFINGKTELWSPSSFQLFNLKTEERGLNKKLNWERMLEQEKLNEEQARLFKASPMPMFTPPEKLQYLHTETVPCPFQLTTEERALNRPQFKTDSATETSGFKARPMPDFSNPFIPETGILELTQPMDIELNSDIRAQKRSLFNEQLREKERHQFELQKAQELERQSQEQEEIRALRKQQEFKARLIPSSLQFSCSKSDVESSTAPSLLQIEQRKIFTRMCGDDSICSTFHTDNSLFPSENSLMHDEEMMDFSEL